MKKSIFIISSPLQVINMMEAIGRFNIAHFRAIILLSSNQRNNNMIMSAIQQYQLKNLMIINWKWHNYINFVRQLFILKRLIKEGSNYDYLFLGDYRQYIQHLFAMNLSYDNFYLLDDGTITLTIQNSFLNPPIVYAYKEGGLKNQVTYLISRYLFWLKTRIIEMPNLFTMFDIQPHNNQEVVKNNFDLIHERVKNFERYDGSVFFLGSNMYVNNVIDFDKYSKVLGNISKYFTGKVIDYLPHRGEPEKYLKIIKEKFGFKIVKPESIIELEILRGKRYPLTIASFFSTGLFSLKMMLPESDVISFKIDPCYLNDSNRERIADYYRYYSKYFKVINLSANVD